ncbi:hypothetical protein V3C99_001764 [Haemonchus contortus]
MLVTVPSKDIRCARKHRPPPFSLCQRPPQNDIRLVAAKPDSSTSSTLTLRHHATLMQYYLVFPLTSHTLSRPYPIPEKRAEPWPSCIPRTGNVLSLYRNPRTPQKEQLIRDDTGIERKGEMSRAAARTARKSDESALSDVYNLTFG